MPASPNRRFNPGAPANGGRHPMAPQPVQQQMRANVQNVNNKFAGGMGQGMTGGQAFTANPQQQSNQAAPMGPQANQQYPQPDTANLDAFARTMQQPLPPQGTDKGISQQANMQQNALAAAPQSIGGGGVLNQATQPPPPAPAAGIAAATNQLSQAPQQPQY